MTSMLSMSSGFCFVLGNISRKLKSRLCDINLVMIFPATLISKYWYQLILQSFLEDLEKPETSGIKIVVEGRSTFFRGTLAMVTADNLAAHTLGGYIYIHKLYIDSQIDRQYYIYITILTLTYIFILDYTDCFNFGSAISYARKSY